MMFAQAESLPASLYKLEGLLNEYSPLLCELTGRVMDTSVNYGAVFAEVSSLIW